jgi:transcriptional regulator with XRE-family HTH domain
MPPTLGGTCLAIRKALGLSRGAAYRAHGVSQSYLFDIEHDIRIPSDTTLNRLIDAYGLDSQRSRHLRELRAPAQNLPATDELGTQLRHHTRLLRHLDYLENHGILGAYVDPLYNILACNDIFRTAWPGSTDTNSLLTWIFQEQSARLAPDRDREAAHTVAIARALAGRYRASGQTKKLLQQLADHDEFTERWISTIDVAYSRSPDELLHRRHPDTGEPVSFIMSMTEVLHTPHISHITLLPLPYHGPDTT